MAALQLRLSQDPMPDYRWCGGAGTYRNTNGLSLRMASIHRMKVRSCNLHLAARADLCRRLGRTAEARASYERALSLTQQEPERRFLERRLAALSGQTG